MSIIEDLGSWLPLVVLLATFLESAAFVGLVVPGETVAVVAGAAAAIRGDGPVVILLAAVIGAVAGDAVGFGLGRRYGARLTDHRRLRRFRTRLEQSRSFVERRGWWSLVLARFVSVLRAVVPFSAGAVGMSYPRFFLGNMIGGILWGVGAAGLGYLAGTRWYMVESWIKTIGVTMAVLAALIGLVVWSARWIARNPERTRALLDAGGPVVRRLLLVPVTLLNRPRPAIHLLANVGVATTATAAFVLAGWIDWSFVEGRVLLDVLEAEASIRVGASRLAELLGVFVAAVVAVGVVAGTSRWTRLTLIVVSTALTVVVAAVVAMQIQRPSVDLPGLGVPGPFPDMATAVAAALVLSTAWPLTRGWAGGARILGAALATALAIAGVRLIALEARPVDIVAGLAAGVAVVVWTATFVDPRLGGRPLPMPRLWSQAPVDWTDRPGVYRRERRPLAVPASDDTIPP
jgi:undecaprenyl-diphosphatase